MFIVINQIFNISLISLFLSIGSYGKEQGVNFANEGLILCPVNSIEVFDKKDDKLAFLIPAGTKFSLEFKSYQFQALKTGVKLKPLKEEFNLLLNADKSGRFYNEDLLAQKDLKYKKINFLITRDSGLMLILRHGFFSGVNFEWFYSLFHKC